MPVILYFIDLGRIAGKEWGALTRPPIYHNAPDIF
jgi:hypothetical protein